MKYTPTTSPNQPIAVTLMKPFLVTASGAYVVNSLYWIIMLMHVYSSRDFRISQFSLMALSQVLLPVVFFLVAYSIVLSGLHSRIVRSFYAAIAAIIGVLFSFLTVYVLYISPASTYIQLEVLNVTNSPNIYSVIEIATTTALFLLLMSGIYLFRRATVEVTMMRAFLVVAVLSLIATITGNLFSGQFYGRGSELLGMELTMSVVSYVILPLVFAGMAAVAVRKWPVGKKWPTIVVLVAVAILLSQALTSALACASMLAKSDIFAYDVTGGALQVGLVLVIYGFILVRYVPTTIK